MTITIETAGEGPQKRRIVERAFGFLGLAGYEFGRTPEEMQDGLDNLNDLCAEWPYNLLGYRQPDYGSGSGEQASGIPAEALVPVAAELSVRLAPIFGVQLGGAAQRTIMTSVNRIHALVAAVPTMPYADGTPKGAGYRYTTDPYIREARLAPEVETPAADTVIIDGGG